MSIPFLLWGQRGWAGAEVAGESHYAKEIRSLFGRQLSASGTELEIEAQLLPEPQNKHDPNAVGVWSGSRQLGYLPREEAARYTSILTKLVAQGWAPQVMARVWGSEWSDTDGRRTQKVFQGSVRLDLAEPHMLVPANMPPSGAHRLLPRGHAIQVAGEEHHMEALYPLLCPEGECWAHVTLHELVEQLARTTRTVVEVRIDDARVGQLTPKMSSELLPAIRHLADKGITTAARAIVKGNRIKAEVVLQVARAHELSETWLDSAGTATARVGVNTSAAAPPPRPAHAHRPVPPAPTTVRFTVPPAWPQPPVGWNPPPGWLPDPTWEPAPDDWQWWVPSWD